MEEKQSAQKTALDCSNVQCDVQNVEKNKSQKFPYPKRVLLILGNELCERFTFYGMSAILSLYLNEKLGYNVDQASALYHGYIMFSYAMCLLGGIISDSLWGKFKTILYLSIVYIIGCVTLSISAIPTINLPAIAMWIGLILIGIGSGGIKPCVSTFGGDQFKLPEQAAQMATFFSLFYFSISFGSLISTAITPILRSDVHCFGENDCYSLAFGVPAILMIIANAFFLVGKSSYTNVGKSSENMLILVSKCIWHAITTKIREGRCNPRENLLDYSIDKYGQPLIRDIRVLVRILILFLPFPIYWALFMQMGSRWTFQAKQMNGDLGFYIIKPDQMQMLEPLLVLIFIPLFDAIIYPILRCFGIQRPLQKMVIGGSLLAISFIFASMVQFRIDAQPKNTVHMLWQLPQYFSLSMSDVMFALIGLRFSYEESPKTMKSITTACFLLMIGLGNLLTLLLVSNGHIFSLQVHEFLFFGGLMFVDVIIFSILAYFYKSSVKKEQLELNTR